MDSGKNRYGSKKNIYWVITLIVALVFLVTGIGNLIPFAHLSQDMAHLGYPTYFLKILGTWKILAAITILVPGNPRIKDWAYSGMMFDLTGGALSRFAMGDGLQMIIIPLALASLVMISYIK